MVENKGAVTAQAFNPANLAPISIDADNVLDLYKMSLHKPGRLDDPSGIPSPQQIQVLSFMSVSFLVDIFVNFRFKAH